VKVLIVTMSDSTRWAVPVDVIARNRAAHYAHEFDGDVERSLNEDTLPLFAVDDYEIEDWAKNNMNWSDVMGSAWRVESPSKEALYEDDWPNAPTVFQEME
jgi:hypothetical protein